MLTAMQSARVKLINNLVQSRTNLLDCRSSIAFDQDQHMIIDGLVKEVDDLLLQLVPNEPI